MASETAHLECANRTHKTIEHLLADLQTHSPWIATAALYKALHVVEAAFANDKSIQHTSNHDERGHKLKKVRKYEHVARHYFPLFRASQIARYLTDHDTFDAYMTPQQVKDKLLKHYLHQVEESCSKFLSDGSELTRARSL